MDASRVSINVELDAVTMMIVLMNVMPNPAICAG